jgi:TonB family protein
MARQLLTLMLLLLAVSALLVARSGGSPPQSGNSNSTPAQTSEASNPPSGQAPAPSPVAAPGDSTKLEPIKVQKADYPLEAAREGLQGQVEVKVLVSETGDVESVEVIRGDPILAKAAVSAAKKWKFKPFIRGGKPVKVATQIPFDFAFGDKIKDTSPPKDAATDKGGSEQRMRVSPGVSRGLLIHQVQPIYPESARRNHVQGTVVLQAEIGKNGRVADLKPISGPKELIPAAMGAVQQWRYKPYSLNGSAVAVETQIVVNFTLSGW